MLKSFAKRLADLPLSEVGIDGSNVLNIAHESIGNHMGSPREAVARMLKYFQKEVPVEPACETVKIINRNVLRKLAK